MCEATVAQKDEEFFIKDSFQIKIESEEEAREKIINMKNYVRLWESF